MLDGPLPAAGVCFAYTGYCNMQGENSHWLFDCLFMTFRELVNIALQFYDSFKPDQCQGCRNGRTRKNRPHRQNFPIRRRCSFYYPNKSACVPVRTRVNTRTFNCVVGFTVSLVSLISSDLRTVHPNRCSPLPTDLSQSFPPPASQRWFSLLGRSVLIAKGIPPSRSDWRTKILNVVAKYPCKHDYLARCSRE